MKTAMTASRLRVVLAIAMVLIAVAATAGFVFAQGYLSAYATSISKMNADASAGDQNLETLRNLETQLADDASLVAKTRSVIADNATYTDKFITDISRIAAEAGVTVNGVEFPDGTGSAQASSANTSSTTTPPAQPAPAAPQPSGVTKKTVTVSVASPLSYPRFMTLLQKIETNTMKMQVTSVSLTKDKGNDVTTPSLTIEIYVR